MIEAKQPHLSELEEDKLGRWQRRFVISGGVILLITALAKITSSFGASKVLLIVEPIFGIKFRYMMQFAAFLELVVAAFCFLDSGKRALMLIAWLASSFTLYHLGLWYAGWHHPCPCMGSLMGVLSLSPKASSIIAKSILAYLLAGSYFMLVASKQIPTGNVKSS